MFEKKNNINAQLKWLILLEYFYLTVWEMSIKMTLKESFIHRLLKYSLTFCKSRKITYV